MRWGRFTLLNASSALLWTIVLVGGGYLFGATFDRLGLQTLAGISILLLGVFLVTFWRIWWLKSSEELQNNKST
jgi:membrane-associated protein